MQRRLIGGVGLLVLGVVVGCGSSTTNETAANQGANQPAGNDAAVPRERSPREEPIVVTTERFLEAVLQGDSEQAIRQMTPQASAQILASGEAFSPPGLDTGEFEVGQIRMPSDVEAIVQCFLIEKSAEGTTQDELCCMLKYEAGRWGISGIAFQVSPQQPPNILNFEQPAQSGPSQHDLEGFAAEPPFGNAPGDDAPVHTAQPSGLPIAR